MATNNVLFLNAAYNNVLSGIMNNRHISDTVAADQADLYAAANAAATQIDSKIPNDAAANQSKADLIGALTFGQFSGRVRLSAVAADYDNEATIIANLYNAAKVNLQ